MRQTKKHNEKKQLTKQNTHTTSEATAGFQLGYLFYFSCMCASSRSFSLLLLLLLLPNLCSSQSRRAKEFYKVCLVLLFLWTLDSASSRCIVVLFKYSHYYFYYFCRMLHQSYRLTVSIVVLLLTVNVAVVRAKDVTVTVAAPWNQTSLLAEATEYFGSVGNDVMWSFVDHVHAIAKDSSIKGVPSQKDLHIIALNAANSMKVSPETLKALELALAARVYSPAVEAHRQAWLHSPTQTAGKSTDSSSFVVSPAGGALLTTAAAVSAMTTDGCTAGTQRDEVFEFDHRSPVPKDSRSSTCGLPTLYCFLGTASCADLQAALRRAKLPFVLRHYAPEAWNPAPVFVQGYGVRMDVKNMEYKAVDEKAEAAQGDAPRDELPNVVAGLDLPVLRERYENIASSINDAARVLMDGRSGDSDELKVWELPSLGYQAAHHVLTSADPLHALEDLLHNFPKRAGRVSRIPSDVTKAAKKSLQQFQKMRMVAEEKNMLMVNGRVVEAAELNHFKLFDIVREERAMERELLDALTNLGGDSRSALGAADALKYLSTVMAPPPPEESSPGFRGRQVKTKAATRFHIPKHTIQFLNDIEMDHMYGMLAKPVKTILQRGPYGQPKFVRKNLFHCVFVIDPSTKEGLDAAVSLAQLMQQGVPVRMGVVLVDPALAGSGSSSAEAAAGPAKLEVKNPDALVESPFDPAAIRKTEDARSSAEIEEDDSVSKPQPDAEVSVAGLVIEGFMQAMDDSRENALRFLYALYQEVEGHAADRDTVLRVAQMMQLDDIEDSAATRRSRNQRQEVVDRLYGMGLTEFPFTVVNGLLFKDKEFNQALMEGFQQELPVIQELVKTGVLTDETQDLYTAVMTAKKALARYQPAVFELNNFTSWASQRHASWLGTVDWINAPSYNFMPSLISHIVVADLANVEGLSAIAHGLSHFVNCPPRTEGEGDTCADSRLAMMHCPASWNDEASHVAAVLSHFWRSMSDVSEKKQSMLLLNVVNSVLKRVQTPKDLSTDAPRIVADAMEALGSKYKKIYANFDSAEALKNLRKVSDQFCSLVAVDAATPAVLYTNGRRTPLSAQFGPQDFALLEENERSERGHLYKERLTEQLDLSLLLTTEGVDPDNTWVANRIAAVYSVLGVHSDRLSKADGMFAAFLATEFPKGAGVRIPAKATDGVAKPLTVTAVVNPVSVDSQRVSSLLRLLHDSFGAEVTLLMNPPDSLSSVPIKSFYRTAFSDSLLFDEDGNVLPPGVRFTTSTLPAKSLLTMGLDEPESWLVFPTRAAYDLDNIQLSKVRSASLDAEYTIQSIMLTGGCLDTTKGAPPRGMPLIANNKRGKLSRDDGARDTLVMSNFGYFQLKANPGPWYINIGHQNKADDIYEIIDTLVVDTAYFDPRMSGGAKSTATVPITSWLGKHIYLKVARKPGKEKINFLTDDGKDEEYDPYEDEEESSLVSRLLFGADGGKRKKKREQVDYVKLLEARKEANGGNRPQKPTLNVFSVASGHLYERFLRMMMYTVMQSSFDKQGTNTTRIKFWLLENYLSPQFKRYLPRLAEKYGLEYELVTYKWPSWLRKQTEKQRTIWGNKILFLDVLFPLDTEKIIFVDADQVVRGDLHELYNLDLDGKPVAYTPFCQENIRPETKGFRFWDSGYWVSHLQGKPYHISAIYVVDLKLFRRRAAGDQYRMIYDNLAADPNSLSNLDQDLPNYVSVSSVPIFSLPEEWLWCETWCSDESKKQAKTIDLCNNPLTKTPKLENAKRIIPEWTEWDAMLAGLENHADHIGA